MGSQRWKSTSAKFSHSTRAIINLKVNDKTKLYVKLKKALGGGEVWGERKKKGIKKPRVQIIKNTKR